MDQMDSNGYPSQLSLWIGGQWIPAGDRLCDPVISPNDGAEIGRLPRATKADLKDAIEAARQAFAPWRDRTANERYELLREVGVRLRQGTDELAMLIAIEQGKPLKQARREVDRAAGMFDWAAEEGRRVYGRTIPGPVAGLTMTAALESVGPVAAFSGWNAPAMTPARKIASAMAAGCSVVIKPSEATPATALFLARAITEAGAPSGVVNMVFGDPPFIADTLLASRDIRMVTFTGSVPVGKHLAELAARTMKRTVLELGGHAPVLIFPDVDVDSLARASAVSAFRNAGQSCTSPTRFVVHDSIYDRFVERLAAEADALKVGDPFSASTNVGPVQSRERIAAIESLVADAKEQGARVVAGGKVLEQPGFYYAPTVLADVSDKCRVAQDEPFGPIATVSPFSTVDEALQEANRLDVGLAAYLFTKDVQVIDRVSREIEAGNLAVNHWTVSYPESPFGGIQDSGVGSEGGSEGVRAFLQTKLVSRLG
jgi:succinate-semialdehyde dehydrogenase / glutarate-semialdehyde dehydrogenase